MKIELMSPMHQTYNSYEFLLYIIREQRVTLILFCFYFTQDPTRNPAVSKYTLKMNKDGKDYEEQVDVDTEKETETFHVPKTSPDDEAGDIVYDFKQVIT